MYSIFTKHQNNKVSIVDDFINNKHKEYEIEEERSIKNDR
jgi:hypothetical protein